MIMNFLKEQKAKREYLKICKEMHEMNVDRLTDKDGFVKTKSKLGNLEYEYDSRCDGRKLSLDGQVVFHREAIYTDVENLVLDTERLDYTKAYLEENKEGLSPINLKSAIERYSKMDNKFKHFNTGNKEEIQPVDGIQMKNKIGNVEYDFNLSMAGEEVDNLITVKMNNEIIFQVHKNSHGDSVNIVKTSKLEKAEDSISNELGLKNDDVKNKSRMKNRM